MLRLDKGNEELENRIRERKEGLLARWLRGYQLFLHDLRVMARLRCRSGGIRLINNFSENPDESTLYSPRDFLKYGGL
jgi:hypothetical protein